MLKNFQSNKAFSLIELSIVILIIGILVAGVTSSSRLIRRMKVISAQNITKGAPVPTIKDLALWYESSLDVSFDIAEETDTTPITNWYDLNTQSSYKINGLQATVANKPKFSENIINGLPSILFDGTDDFIVANQVGISGKGLTVFIVGQNRALISLNSGLVAGVSLTSTDEANAGAFQAFFDAGSTALVSNAAGVAGSSVTQISPRINVPYIASTVFNGTNNIAYINANVGTTVATSPTFLVDRLYIGSRFLTSAAASFHSGYISEIIIYNRGITTEERSAVITYLSKKYAIKT